MSIKKDLIKINIIFASKANEASQSSRFADLLNCTKQFVGRTSAPLASYATLITKVNVKPFKNKVSNLSLSNMMWTHNVCSGREATLARIDKVPLTIGSYSTNISSLEIIMIFACAILSINIILFTIDMLTLYISIELFSFTSFFLILITPSKRTSQNETTFKGPEGPTRAEQSSYENSTIDTPSKRIISSLTGNATVNAFIYFIFNTISSIIILIYFLLIYKNFGFLNFSNFSVLLSGISSVSLSDTNILPLINNEINNDPFKNISAHFVCDTGSISSSLSATSAMPATLESWLSNCNTVTLPVTAVAHTKCANIYISGNLFFIGFLLKLGLSPFHFWIISLYDSISPKITFYISTIPKIIYFFIILKFLYLAEQRVPFIANFNILNNPSIGLDSSETGGVLNIFIIFIILSLIFGSFLGINNKRIIKLFASSSITNTGFILLFIISSIVINNSVEASLNSSDFYTYSVYHYIILYMINIYNFFYILLNFYNFNHIYLLKDFKWSFPFLSFIFFISILSFIGIPPLSGFFNKFYLFINCIFSFNIIIYILLFLSIIISIINTNFYLFFIKFLLGKRSVNYKYTSLFKINKNNKYPKLNQLPLTISFIFIAFYPFFSYNFFNIINLVIY